MSYSLLTEPWIPVRQAGKMQSIGLKQLFTEWDTISDIYADNPPRQIALYRFAIALIHSALREPDSLAGYKQLWADKNLSDRICEYLLKWQNRFDLLHPEYPFLQDIIIDDIKQTSIVKAVYQDANTPIIWFKPRDILWLSLADAAQELLRLQSMDLGGKKSDSITVGAGRWTQGRHIFPIGSSLKETLLLNLGQYEPIEKDKPAWEREQPYGTGERSPTGYLDWLTYCDRRILLTVDGDRVTHIRLAAGWKMPSEFSYIHDRHQAFRFLSKSDVWLPSQFSAQKQLWDDSEAILHTVEETNDRPKIFDWLSDARKLKNPQPVRVLGFAHAGGTQAAKPVHWADDVLAIPESILEDTDLWEGVESGIGLSRSYGGVFTTKVFQYLPRKTGDRSPETLNKGEQDTIKTQLPSLQAALHAYIGQQFPGLLLDLGYYDRAPARLEEWQQQLQDYSHELANLLIPTLPNYRSRAIVKQMVGIAIHQAGFNPKKGENNVRSR